MEVHEQSLDKLDGGPQVGVLSCSVLVGAARRTSQPWYSNILPPGRENGSVSMTRRTSYRLA